MPIIVKLDGVLYARRMTLTELSERIGITLANLSILKTGKARAVRFSTLVGAGPPRAPLALHHREVPEDSGRPLEDPRSRDPLERRPRTRPAPRPSRHAH
jgi:putative transcriptional regulator